MAAEATEPAYNAALWPDLISLHQPEPCPLSVDAPPTDNSSADTRPEMTSTSLSLSERLSRLVHRHRVSIVILWLAMAVVARVGAPSWESIAADGDFDQLPSGMSSVSAERLLDEAFPGQRARSQIVLVFARDEAPLGPEDDLISLDVMRRLYHRMAEVTLARNQISLSAGQSLDDTQTRTVEDCRAYLDEAIRLDQAYFDLLTKLDKVDLVPVDQLRLTLAYWDRAQLLYRIGEGELAASDEQAAITLQPEIAQTVLPINQRSLESWTHLIDLLSWQDAVVGAQMIKPHARMAVLLSSAELAATSNIDFVTLVQQLNRSVLDRHAAIVPLGLQLLATGSAAVGGETLVAAREAIKYTEWLTVLLILLILALVYRAPLLILVPVLSIGIAVAVSSGLVAWLTILSRSLDWPYLKFEIFTTSRIFVVVILFGSGTDFCLFLISRLREEMIRRPWAEASVASLSGVAGALFGSALTTILGLGMLGIAQFGKFAATGPIIAICLAVGLLVCLTFTPALLSLIGPRSFWPSSVARLAVQPGDRSRETIPSGIWGLIALKLTRYPIMALTIGLVALVPPAIVGYLGENDVTYDISSQLNATAESRRGFEVLAKHFDIGRVNPTTVLLKLPDAKSKEDLSRQARELAESLYEVPGVVAVRSADDPLGDFPPDRAMSLLSADAWRRRALKTHRIARNYFFSDVPRYSGKLARLDVVIDGNPFEMETANRVEDLRQTLIDITNDAQSPWYHAQLSLAGTTPSIIDLRSVTLADNRNIKIAVILAVSLALWVVIRRLWLCGYLIVTVLLSFYATLGLTILFFRLVYGADYVGLDWKLPLFLFVILVAVGQDYNVYLVTRILEEQQQRGGWLSALRRAVARTGGIITACGLVMAATFFSMTASAWVPHLESMLGLAASPAAEAISLRGIVELGFALGLGVLIDTFYVRTILVPSFVAVIDRLRFDSRLPAFPDDSEHG